MNILKDKYIIVEIIPDHSNPKYGKICQLQALKIDSLKLIDRFDYRLNKELIDNPAILDAIDYDNDNFIYVYDSKKILDDFKEFIENYNLFLIDDTYTKLYFESIPNDKELVYPLLGLQHGSDVFDKIINKYNLEPSNHLVDLVYEALIYESNKK